MVAGQSSLEVRKVKTTNLLNFIVCCSLLTSVTHYFFLGDKYSVGIVLALFLISLASMILNGFGKTTLSFLLFTLNVNAAIFYYCLHHSLEAGTCFYFFPLIVSVVLLNNPSVRDTWMVVHFSICVVFFAACFLVEIPGIQADLSRSQIVYLQRFNLFSSAIITALLSFLLTRLVSSQNYEIVTQNEDLRKTKEAVNVSLKEKEVLLAELHHRVKNNLAIISGLLNLQEDATNSEEAKQILGDSKSRIMSMALVHKMLYENPELKSIHIGKYASELIYELFNSYNLGRSITITEEYDDFVLPVSKSIPLGLILNEVVTNCIKYVFKSVGKQKGQFYISIRHKGNDVTLTVRDNGKGFPGDFDPESSNLSLGIYLIKTLAEQIDGQISFSNDNGAKIELVFPLT